MSAYRDQFPPCPSCKTELVSAGAGRACPACSGVWIAESVLTEMVWVMHSGAETLPLVWIAREPTERRACPDCGELMACKIVEEVPVERCERGHGVWLDASELERTLHNSSRRPPRSDGIEVDLSPIDAGSESSRRRQLRGWHAATLKELERHRR